MASILSRPQFVKHIMSIAYYICNYTPHRNVTVPEFSLGILDLHQFCISSHNNLPMCFWVVYTFDGAVRGLYVGA